MAPTFHLDPMLRRTATLITLLAVAAPAAAHHTATPPVVRLTSSGDNSLPRCPAYSDTLALALQLGPDPSVYSLHLFHNPQVMTLVSAGGDSGNPSAAAQRVIAFDSDGDPYHSGDPGRQVFVRSGANLFQITHDPTGTSTNPSLDFIGRRLAFESAGDLTGTGSHTSQIYFQNTDGSLVQVSRGQGTSTNPSLSRGGTTIAFESTSDSITGMDTGISQIWLSSITPGTSRAITAGQGPSRNPLMSNGGRIMVFESDADLAGGGADTGVPQVFAYDVVTGNFAQVTQEPSGCTAPSAQKRSGDWRIGFSCGGQGFYHDLRADRRYRLPIDGGDTNRVVTGAGYYFIMVSSTADFLGPATTTGHRIYLLNMYKRPAVPVSGSVVWFPARGLRPLR